MQLCDDSTARAEPSPKRPIFAAAPQHEKHTGCLSTLHIQCATTHSIYAGRPSHETSGSNQVDASFAGAGPLCVQARLLLEAYEAQRRATEIPYPLPPVHVTDPNFLQLSVAIREAHQCVLHYIEEAAAQVSARKSSGRAVTVPIRPRTHQNGT